MTDEVRTEPREGAILAEISRGVVQVYAHFYHRGPTRAKTVWRQGLVVCVLEEIFTKAEEVLLEAGRFEQVRAGRQAFQDETEPLFREIVEEATGHRVRAFLSQVTEEGIAAEVFVLEQSPPQGGIGR